MDVLSSLGRTLGFSFAAGVNLYATVAILGFAARYRWVDLPPQYQVFDNNWIMGAAIVLYIVNRPEQYRIDPFAEKNAAPAVSVVPMIGPDGGGFAATVHF